MAEKLRVLVLIDHYIPGYKFGGPLRTLHNMVERLAVDIDFYIITADRDLDSDCPYENVSINGWNRVGKANVFYAAPGYLNFSRLKRILLTTDYDILYLNSFFSPSFTILPLLVRKLTRAYQKPVLIAPRGEFSPGALRLKYNKKALYLSVSKWFGLYKGLVFHASTDLERKDIEDNMGLSVTTIVAPDLVAAQGLTTQRPADTTGEFRDEGPLRIIFLSRISPKKNLSYLLDTLSGITQEMSLSIYGPLEDPSYWAQCEHLIQKLPANISVQYLGDLRPQQVQDVFARHDLFVFPSLGENFGHVVFEALSAGTPVMISDQMPWAADENGAVSVLPLANIELWRSALNGWLHLNRGELAKMRDYALQYAHNYIVNSDAVERNLNLFRFAAAGKSSSADA